MNSLRRTKKEPPSTISIQISFTRLVFSIKPIKNIKVYYKSPISPLRFLKCLEIGYLETLSYQIFIGILKTVQIFQIFRKQKMSKKFNLKVTARVREKSKQSIDLVSFNQLILQNQDKKQIKKFFLDRIYYPTDTNEKLFQNILRVPTNLLLDGFSSMVLCLGSPNSGKTYTLAGKTRSTNAQLGQPGIVTYLMRRLFSKFKHEVSLYSTYSVWCKVLLIERQEITNMTSYLKKIHEINKRSVSISQPYSKSSKNFEANGLKGSCNNKQKIEIKNYSHFEEIIEAVYNNNNSKRHTVIEISLKKQLPSGKSTTSSITFLQFGSFFYSCPFREAEELQMENEIESVINLLKDLSKSEEITQKLFDASILTKTLKQNFLKSTSFEIMGLLDNSFGNNFKTLNFLDMLMVRKNNPKVTKNVKQEIKREEIFLKNLYDKHRKILNLLSRCIGMELGSLEKKKRNGNLDGPIMNSFYKTCEKVKFANLKKQQNQKILEEIRKDIEKEIGQRTRISQEYQEKLTKFQEQKTLLVKKKAALQSNYNAIVFPSIKFNNTDYSLYWKPDDNENILTNGNKYALNAPQMSANQGEQELGGYQLMDSERDSKQGNKSLKLLPSDNGIPSTLLKNTIDNYHKFRHKNLEKYQRQEQAFEGMVEKRVAQQMKWEVGKLFGLIVEKQKKIEDESANLINSKKYGSSNILINRIKNRGQMATFNHAKALSCYKQYLQKLQVKKQNKQKDRCSYAQFMENLSIQDKIQRDIQNKANMLSSLKSLTTDKFIKN